MEVALIKQRIHELRGQSVLLDVDLAELYGVETRVLNQAVKRNRSRFPADFMFQLTKEELENLKSQFVTSSWGGTRVGGLAASHIASNFEVKIDERMTVTVEILDQHALNLLRELERMHVIRLFGVLPKHPHMKALKKEFNAVRLDTRGFKFNREEANER